MPNKTDDALQLLFNKLTDNKASFNFEQFYNKLKSVDINLSKIDLKKQWEIIDVDHSDDMDFGEFKSLMRRNFEINDPKIIVQNAFYDLGKKILSSDTYKTLIDSKNNNIPGGRRITQIRTVAVPINSKDLKQRQIEEKELNERLEKVFNIIDDDKSGTIEFEEILSAVKILEIPINTEDLKTTFQFFDSDKNGHIDLDEFKRWMKSQIVKYWTKDSNSNQFVQLQRAWSLQNVEKLQSTKASQTGNKSFDFDVKDNGQKKQEVISEKYKIFVDCKLSEVQKFDCSKIGDYVEYMYRGKEYDAYRDKYVSIFMTHNIDGKKFLDLDRRKIARMGIENKSGKRHVTVVWNELRHCKKRV